VVGTKNHLTKAGTPVYQKWHEQVKRYMAGATPSTGPYGSCTTRTSCSSGTQTRSSSAPLVPVSPTRTLNVVEYYYTEEVALFEREYVEAQQAAYAETAWEDEIIGQRTDRGRQTLLADGIDDYGPIQSPMEDGIVYFQEWVRRRLEPHL